MSAATRFRAWVSELGPTAAAEQVARLSGLKVDRSYFSHISAGRRVPGLRVAAAIERATRELPGGPIMAAEWVRDGRASEAA